MNTETTDFTEDADGMGPIRWKTVLADGRRISVLVRSQAINLLVNEENPSFTFDPLGRLHGAFYEGRNYRRSLDNRMLSKWAEQRGGRRRRQCRWLVGDEARTIVEAAYDVAGQVKAQAAGAPPGVQQALADVARWDWVSLEADRLRFQQIYTPVGILPPDQYLALVLQATHGCSHNACTFCTFYRDVLFRIKTPDEFRRHTAAVLDFFGPAVRMRRSIFLADANALVIPMARLLGLLDVFAEAASSRWQVAGGNVANSNAGPIYEDLAPDTLTLRSLPLFAFIDAFHVERKSVADWQELRARGLRRVYIGMESGYDPLLRWLNKPGDAADVLDAVVTLKTAGLAVSLIVMLGVGGDRYATGHVRDTIALLNAMPLGKGDLIYFSDFVEHAEAPYTALAAADGVRPLHPDEMRAQEMALRSAFVPADPQRPPQFSRYDIEEFVY